MTLFNPTFSEAIISKYNHIGVRVSTYEFGKGLNSVYKSKVLKERGYVFNFCITGIYRKWHIKYSVSTAYRMTIFPQQMRNWKRKPLTPWVISMSLRMYVHGTKSFGGEERTHNCSICYLLTSFSLPHSNIMKKSTLTHS